MELSQRMSTEPSAVRAPELYVPSNRIHAIRSGQTAVASQPTLARVTGSGAVDCLQGLFTNDLAKPGTGRLSYGAFLTPKGMIVLDAWVIRLAEELLIIAPAERREALADYLHRQLPPRLARSEDVSDSWGARWLLGQHAIQSWRSVSPTTGVLAELTAAREGEIFMGRAPALAPFAIVLAGPETALTEIDSKLEQADFTRGTLEDFEAMRVLAGWPRVDREIDERTLPQEVRFDELRGVSYEKGCYVGQETVARLHFRGHTNRILQGLVWDDPAPLESDVVTATDTSAKVLGRVTSSVVVDQHRVGLGVIRREVVEGAAVRAGGVGAKVKGLPHVA